MPDDRCKEVCPVYAVCKGLQETGQEMLLVSEQVEDRDSEAAEHLASGGNDLIGSGENLGRWVLEGCAPGPIEVQGRAFCMSDNKNIGFSQEDLDIAESNIRSIKDSRSES